MGFDSLFFFGWMDSTSVGPLVHDVPLRWPRVSPRVVVRRFHHERDDPPPAKVPGGRAVESAQARQASPAGAPMLPFPVEGRRWIPRRPSLHFWIPVFLGSSLDPRVQSGLLWIPGCLCSKVGLPWIPVPKRRLLWIPVPKTALSGSRISRPYIRRWPHELRFKLLLMAVLSARGTAQQVRTATAPARLPAPFPCGRLRSRCGQR